MTAARRPSTRRLGAFMALALAVTGCTVQAAAPDDTPRDTVGDVGLLPGSFTEASDAATDTVAVTETSAPGTSIAEETTSTPPSVPEASSIGQQVTGNRVLMIGDSITASISQRYGGQACDSLVPFGWQVEVDAETGRFIDFGARVLDKRLDAGWDAVVIFLGNNYGEDRGVYQLALHSMLLRTAPRPTVLITTTMFRDEQAEVNAAILEEAALFDNVTVLDWESVSADPSLTGADGLHLTEAGRVRLGYLLAAALGEAPTGPGACLSTTYRDDSAGSPNGPSGNSSGTKTTVKPTPTTNRPTATTTKPATTVAGGGSTGTTIKPGTGTTTASTAPTSSSTGSTTASTAPASTAAATTTPSPLPPGPPVQPPGNSTDA